MKITDFKESTVGGNKRFAATVIWEDCAREPLELFFDVGSEYADGLTANPNAFLVAAVTPAVEEGEKRIAVDGEICPRVKTGLLTILDVFKHWFGGPGTIEIEAKKWAAGNVRRGPERAGSFFTGGVDSLATVWRNRKMFPRDHSESLKDAILLYGINFDSDDSPAVFARAVTELSKVAKDAEVELVPVTTNCRRVLITTGKFFAEKFHAALLAAVGHILRGRLTTLSIASSHDTKNLIPWGSHPLVDPNFSSFDLRIYHDSLELSRLDKTRLVSDWQVGLDNIKVCTVNWPGVNCGKCEKCIRTMLELLAVGALDRSRSFEPDDVSADAIHTIKLNSPNQPHYYEELIEPLRELGRNDLVSAIESILAAYWGENGLLGPIKRLDRIHFGNSLRKLKQSLRRNGDRGH